MKCIVSGCDTDEYIVSYTSVFFVKFPTEPLVQDQWLTLLGVNDTDLMQALLAGDAKVCSCHFTDDCFAQHPAYGYRSVLPNALPTILPHCNLEDLLREPTPPSDDDISSNCYFVFDDVDSEAIPLGQETLALVANMNDMNVVKFANKEDENTTADDVDDEALEIGIKYENGKFYFLQLDGDLPEESSKVPSIDKTNEPDYMEPWEDMISTSNDFPNDVEDSDGLTNEALEDEKHIEELHEELISDVKEQVVDFAECPTESQQAVVLEKIEKIEGDLDSNDASSTQFIDDDEVVNEESNEGAIQTHDINPNASDGQSDEATEYIMDDNRSEPADFGSIEALDEVSVCGGKVRVRARNERIDRHFCDVCGKGFPYPSALNTHILIHSKIKAYSCDLCDKSFAQKVNLDVHIRQHTGLRPLPRYCCAMCGRKCYRKNAYRNHLAMHRRKYPIKCPACETLFADVTSLYTHLRQDHQNEVTMQQCLDMFVQNATAEVIVNKQPVSDTLFEDGRWGCSVCGKRFTMKITLARHKRKVHPKIFSCQYCWRKFPYRSMLEKHLPVHTHERAFQCTHCNASFTQRNNLHKHVQCKHNRRNLASRIADDVVVEDLVNAKIGAHQCAQCGKSFTRRATWQAHLDSHNNSDDLTPTCETCGLSFASKTSLRNHCRRQHTKSTLDGKKVLTADQLRAISYDSLSESIIERVDIYDGEHNGCLLAED